MTGRHTQARPVRGGLFPWRWRGFAVWGAAHKKPAWGGHAGGPRRHAGSQGYALKLLPQPQLLVALGLLNTNPRPMTSSLKSMLVPLRYR